MTYHDKKYPCVLTVRITEKQEKKIKGNKSEFIRNILDTIK
jgi:hypothetical protein